MLVNKKQQFTEFNKKELQIIYFYLYIIMVIKCNLHQLHTFLKILNQESHILKTQSMQIIQRYHEFTFNILHTIHKPSEFVKS